VIEVVIKKKAWKIGKTVIPVKDSVAVYAGVLSCSRVRNVEARTVRSLVRTKYVSMRKEKLTARMMRNEKKGEEKSEK